MSMAKQLCTCWCCFGSWWLGWYLHPAEDRRGPCERGAAARIPSSRAWRGGSVNESTGVAGAAPAPAGTHLRRCSRQQEAQRRAPVRLRLDGAHSAQANVATRHRCQQLHVQVRAHACAWLAVASAITEVAIPRTLLRGPGGATPGCAAPCCHAVLRSAPVAMGCRWIPGDAGTRRCARLPPSRSQSRCRHAGCAGGCREWHCARLNLCARPRRCLWWLPHAARALRAAHAESACCGGNKVCACCWRCR